MRSEIRSSLVRYPARPSSPSPGPAVVTTGKGQGQDQGQGRAWASQAAAAPSPRTWRSLCAPAFPPPAPRRRPPGSAGRGRAREPLGADHGGPGRARNTWRQVRGGHTRHWGPLGEALQVPHQPTGPRSPGVAQGPRARRLLPARTLLRVLLPARSPARPLTLPARPPPPPPPPRAQAPTPRRTTSRSTRLPGPCSDTASGIRVGSRHRPRPQPRPPSGPTCLRPAHSTTRRPLPQFRSALSSPASAYATPTGL